MPKNKGPASTPRTRRAARVAERNDALLRAILDHDDVAVSRLLLEEGADPNARLVSPNGRTLTPLHAAVGGWEEDEEGDGGAVGGGAGDGGAGGGDAAGGGAVGGAGGGGMDDEEGVAGGGGWEEDDDSGIAGGGGGGRRKFLPDPEVVGALLRAGADPLAKTSSGREPWHVLVESGVGQFWRPPNLDGYASSDEGALEDMWEAEEELDVAADTLEALARGGADINAVTDDDARETPLMMAQRRGETGLAIALFQMGARAGPPVDACVGCAQAGGVDARRSSLQALIVRTAAEVRDLQEQQQQQQQQRQGEAAGGRAGGAAAAAPKGEGKERQAKKRRGK